MRHVPTSETSFYCTYYVGKALALWLEDFEIDGRRIHIRDRGELSNLAEIKTVCSSRTLDVSTDLINMYLDYITEFHLDEVDTNHVFIKITGKNRYHPLEYGDVASLFKRLSEKTGIQVNPQIAYEGLDGSLRRYKSVQGMLISKLPNKSITTLLMKKYAKHGKG